jgi:hypothetical protein
MKFSSRMFGILFAAILVDCMMTTHMETKPVFECTYNWQDGLLICHHNNTAYINCSSVVEIGTIANYDFGVFRLGWPNVNEGKRFWIYSYNTTDNSVFNQTLSINNVLSNLFVYSADTFIDYGIRVTDFVCFEQFFNNFHFDQIPITTTKRSRSILGDVFTNKYGSYWWGK